MGGARSTNTFRTRISTTIYDLPIGHVILATESYFRQASAFDISQLHSQSIVVVLNYLGPLPRSLGWEFRFEACVKLFECAAYGLNCEKPPQKPRHKIDSDPDEVVFYEILVNQLYESQV
jgi:hypothetical protein